MSTPVRVLSGSTSSNIESPWAKHTDQWHRIGSPLRPCAEDIALFQRELNDVAEARERVSALLMGVTVEITRLAWPRHCTLTAVDLSDAMLRGHWCGPEGIDSLAVRGSWLDQPIDTAAMHLAIADGSLSILNDLQGLTRAARELCRVIAPGGVLLTRAFIRDEMESTPAQVVDEMNSGQIGNFHVFKWRLIMAMHTSSTHGVQLDTVYRAVGEAIPNRARAAAQLGWPADSIDTIDAYKGVNARYFFPCLRQLRDALAGSFREVRCHVPAYELGSRCPILVMERR